MTRTLNITALCLGCERLACECLSQRRGNFQLTAQVIPLAIACLCAAVLGFAAHRASICTVRAVAEIMSARTAFMLASIGKSVLWVVALTLPFFWLMPAAARGLNGWPLTLTALTGGFLFGVGSAINGGCAFSTMARLVDGEVRMAGTIGGFALGIFVFVVLVDLKWLEHPHPAPAFIGSVLMFAIVLSLALLAWALYEVPSIWRNRPKNLRLHHMALAPQYRLSTAAMLIGVSGTVIFLLLGAPGYTITLQNMVLGAIDMDMLPALMGVILMLAVLTGMLASTLQRGSFRLDWRPRLHWLRNVFGGTLMGLGTAMLPGGNDSLVLYGIPAFSPHALPAYAALLAGVTAGLLVMKHVARHGHARGMPQRHLSRRGAAARLDAQRALAVTDELERALRVEPPVVERAAGDRAFELFRPRLEQRADVVDRGETARGDHRNGDGVGERNGGVEIETLEQPVARDVGVDDGGDAGILEAPGDRQRRQFRGFRPAFDRDLAVAGVEPDGNAAGKGLGRLLHQLRIAHRRGADDDAVDALAEPGFHRRHVAHAAAELDRQADGFEDALDRGGVHRLAGEGAVEIDDVQIFEALHLEGARLRRRIAVEDGRARHVALLEPHGEAFLEVDGGKEDQRPTRPVIGARPRSGRASKGDSRHPARLALRASASG